MIRTAKAAGARPLVVFFRDRREVYYQVALGKPLPTDLSSNSQAALLAKLAREEGAEYLDMKDAFMQAAATIDERTPISRYPFLPIDGHPSAVGHQLIARTIAQFLAAHGCPRAD